MPVASERMAVDIWKLAAERIAEAKAKLNGEYVQVVEPRSSLKLDDRYLGSWRGGSLHVTAMQSSVDALLAVSTLLEGVIGGTGALPMTALYPMIRTAIESAALAMYLLEPVSRDERLRRSYLVADADAMYNDMFTIGMGRESQDIRARADAEIRELIATRLTMGDPYEFKFSGVKYSDLVAGAGAVMAADPASQREPGMPLLAWWQLLSGLSHGKQWALITTLERSGAIVDEANESTLVYMTSSAAAVALALLRGVETLEAALRLFGQRSMGAWAQPEDGSEPAFQNWNELHPR